MRFSGKKILIISPQNWEHIKVSKHHYAIELSRLGNEVYFLNPPTSDRKYLEFSVEKINEGLYVVHNSLFFPYRIKNYLKRVFDLLLKFHIRRINKFIGKLDVIWSFSSLYSNLKLFNAQKNILHIVDKPKVGEYKLVEKTADVILATTRDILSTVQKEPRYLIGHGLSSFFAEANFCEENKNYKDILNVCYTGNLLHKAVNREVLLKLVLSFKKVRFHFIGPFENGSMEQEPFIAQIQSLNNCEFYGKLSPEEMVPLYKKMDIFIACYDIKSKYSPNKGANSHKILEYLSTGKVAVTHNIKELQQLDDLLVMDKKVSTETFFENFKHVISNIEYYNSNSLQNKRRNFALQSSYPNRINEIEKILNENDKLQAY